MSSFNGPIEMIGLIGCGTMGRCMLEKLSEAGYPVAVYDPFPTAAAKAAEMGAKIAKSPEKLAQQCAVILMSLPGPSQVEQTVTGINGLLNALTERHIVVDTSTVDPGTTRKMAAHVSEKGAAYLDCPILGRPSAAGKWMLPAGGDAKALSTVKPVLLTFAKDAVHVGDSGAGNALKLLNQMMFSAINAISSEVMAIAEKVGVDKKVFYETVADSGAATVSGLFKEVGKNIVEDNYEHPAFTVNLLIKDTKLALQMAKDAGAPSVIAGTVQIYNEIAGANGLGDKDTSSLYKVYGRHYQEMEISR